MIYIFFKNSLGKKIVKVCHSNIICMTPFLDKFTKRRKTRKVTYTANVKLEINFGSISVHYKRTSQFN